jgi:hypothetical protein
MPSMIPESVSLSGNTRNTSITESALRTELREHQPLQVGNYLNADSDQRLADLYFECHFVDWQANPQIVLTHGTFEGTARKIDDRWLFWHVTAGVNPLTP